MNETTETGTSPEFSAGYLQWIYSLTIISLVFIFFVQPQLKQTMRPNASLIAPPHIVAAGIVIEQGIQEFQTGRAEPVNSNARYSVLASLLILFIFAPTIVLFIVHRQEKEERAAIGGIGVKNSLSTFMLIISLGLLAIIVVGTAAGTYITPSVFDTMKKDNDITYQRDMLVNELVDAYIVIMQYYYQTEKFGGKNPNLFEKTSNGTVRTVHSLSKLGIKEESKNGKLYLEPVSSDTLLILYAVGTKPGSGELFKNYNSDIGKIQFTMTVRTAGIFHEIQNNN